MDVRSDASEPAAQGGEAAPLALDRFMPYRLSVLSSRISQSLARSYRMRFGISLAEWRVLAVLDREQPLSAGEVAARTWMGKVKVSRAITAMERKGLLHRTMDPGDQRVVRLALSAQGLASFRAIAAFAHGYERELMAAVDPALRVELERALDCLSRQLDRLESEAACPP